MGDGNVYGWHRRGVPIPHTVLIASVLFIFGEGVGGDSPDRALHSSPFPWPVACVSLAAAAWVCHRAV